MIVYLWDAGSARGITDNAERARETAERFLRSGAQSAVVEQARTVLSTRSLTDTYNRLGKGWRARLNDGGISWRQLDDES